MSYGDYQMKSHQMNQMIQNYYATAAQHQHSHAQQSSKKNNTLAIVGVGLLGLMFKDEIKTFFSHVFSSGSDDKVKDDKKADDKKDDKKTDPPPTPWTNTDYTPSYYGSVADSQRTGYRTASQTVMHKGNVYFKQGDEYSLAMHDIRKQITRGDAKSLQEAINQQKTTGYNGVVTDDNTSQAPITPGVRNRKAQQSGTYTGFNVDDNDRVGKDVVRHVIYVAPKKTTVTVNDGNGGTKQVEVNLEGEVALNRDFFKDKFGVDGAHFHRVDSFKPAAIEAKMKEVEAEIAKNKTHNGNPVKHEVVVQMLPLHGDDNSGASGVYKMGEGLPNQIDPAILETQLKSLVNAHLSDTNVDTLVMADACYSGSLTK